MAEGREPWMDLSVMDKVVSAESKVERATSRKVTIRLDLITSKESHLIL